MCFHFQKGIVLLPKKTKATNNREMNKHHTSCFPLNSPGLVVENTDKYFHADLDGLLKLLSNTWSCNYFTSHCAGQLPDTEQKILKEISLIAKFLILSPKNKAVSE